MTNEIQLTPNTFLSTTIKRRIPLCGVEFDEDFLSELVSKHMTQFQKHQRPRLSNAFEIYMQENTSSHRRKFQTNANQYFRTFTTFFGDLYLDELSHSHITRYRDHLLARGLQPLPKKLDKNCKNFIFLAILCVSANNVRQCFAQKIFLDSSVGRAPDC